MNKKILMLIAFITIAFLTKAQNLEEFKINMQSNEASGNCYLSISQRKSLNESEAKANKSAIDFTLVFSKDWGGERLEWYNMSGKDNKTPKELNGTATLINAISFDKEQFEQCKTNNDLENMTGYVTKNSLSHFATITDNLEQGIKYHCFIFQLENGKRGLILIEFIASKSYAVHLKIQS